MLNHTFIPQTSYSLRHYKVIYILKYGTIDLGADVFVAAYGNKEGALEHARTELKYMVQAANEEDNNHKVVEKVMDKDGTTRLSMIHDRSGVESDWYIVESTKML